MEERFHEIAQEKAVPRDEYREVLSRLDLLDGNASLIRDELMQTRAEFREDLGELRRETHERLDRMNERFDQMHGRFDEMHHQMIVQTRWLVGSLTIIGTVVSVLLAIAQFTPA
jgi:tetrahydromethanopterin S-methyltransferase subunit G